MIEPSTFIGERKEYYHSRAHSSTPVRRSSTTTVDTCTLYVVLSVIAVVGTCTCTGVDWTILMDYEITVIRCTLRVVALVGMQYRTRTIRPNQIPTIAIQFREIQLRHLVISHNELMHQSRPSYPQRWHKT